MISNSLVFRHKDKQRRAATVSCQLLHFLNRFGQAQGLVCLWLLWLKVHPEHAITIKQLSNLCWWILWLSWTQARGLQIWWGCMWLFQWAWKLLVDSRAEVKKTSSARPQTWIGVSAMQFWWLSIVGCSPPKQRLLELSVVLLSRLQHFLSQAE